MTALLAHIHTLIEKAGPISLARYMDLALQHPEHGYYRTGDPLGRSGDFVTAPEISQMFGELIGLCLAEAWKSMGKPDPFLMIELGPGHGTLMHDALRATSKIHGFHAAMGLRLLESNATLRDAQRKKLAAYDPGIWDDIDELSDPDKAFPALIVANEFFDALPVRQFEKTASGWCERMVGLDGKTLAFVLSHADPVFLHLIPQDLREAAIGTVHEVSLPALTIMRQLTKHIAQYGGAMLLIDYGYVAPPHKGTVQAISAHRHADILERPGEVDLTAHVDFMALRQMAQLQGAKTLGPVTQGEFLQSLGIDMRAKQLKHNATPEQEAAIDTALHRLTDPAEMGTLFKAMAVVGPAVGNMAGF